MNDPRKTLVEALEFLRAKPHEPAHADVAESFTKLMTDLQGRDPSSIEAVVVVVLAKDTDMEPVLCDSCTEPHYSNTLITCVAGSSHVLHAMAVQPTRILIDLEEEENRRRNPKPVN